MGELKVLLALTTEDNDYQREQESVARATADRLGIGLQVLFAGNDSGSTRKRGVAEAMAGQASTAFHPRARSGCSSDCLPRR